MFNIFRGLISSFVATVFISILMAILDLFGLMPELSIVPYLDSELKNPAGIPMLPILGWFVYFLIGTLIWSFAFALFAGKGSDYSPKSYALGFSITLWLVLMTVLMPIAGNGLFGMDIGITVPIVSFILHLIWGWAIAFIYDLLPSTT